MVMLLMRMTETFHRVASSPGWTARPAAAIAADGRRRPLLDDLLVVLDQAVAHGDDALGVLRDVGLVRDQHDGLAAVVQLLEDAHDLFGRARVEVAGRLVGEEDGRIGDQRAGDGHALLLAAGELRRLVVLAAGEADAVRARPSAALWRSSRDQPRSP